MELTLGYTLQKKRLVNMKHSKRFYSKWSTESFLKWEEHQYAMNNCMWLGVSEETEKLFEKSLLMHNSKRLHKPEENAHENNHTKIIIIQFLKTSDIEKYLNNRQTKPIHYVQR